MVQNGCKRSSPILLLRQKLGKKLCKGLPAFHALTGCDTTSAIAGVGKKKPGRFYDVVKHTKKLLMVGLSPTLNDACRVKCEKSLCALYPAVKKTSITAVTMC